jgi:hypothetical protein
MPNTFYTIDDLHYNSKRIIQVSKTPEFKDLKKTLKDIKDEIGDGLERNMFAFFCQEVDPVLAYLDNDANQGKDGPRRLFAVGRLKKMKDSSLFVRLGVSAPNENPLIPSLQALYLKNKEDRWAYEFTERYQGMVEGAKVGTREGINSLVIIPMINEAILNNASLKTKELKE